MAHNRIIASVTRVQQALDEKSGFFPVGNLEATLATLTPSEMAAYQQAKSLAQASGIITLDESVTIYAILRDWHDASLAQRITITQLMSELLKVA